MPTKGQPEQAPPQSAPIASFFSTLQLLRLQRTTGPRRSPAAESHHGAFLFLDMVAFTQLGEQLGEQGVKGAEVLSEILHAYYQPILATVHEHGGDVLFFAGDALGVIWLSPDDEVADVSVRAAQCALAIQSLTPDIQTAWPRPLQFRASLGVGPVEAFEVGGVEDNWMQLVRGEAIDRACRADGRGEGGAVVMSEQCARHLHGCDPVLTPLADGYARLDRINRPAPPRPAPPVEIGAEHEQALAARLTEAVHRHLYYPSSAVAAEFRRTTVLFVDISGVDPQTLHDAVRAAQREALRFEGVVYQLLEDDKGTGVIIVFGLPGNSHADDHLRALLLAKRLSATYETLGVSTRLGIATGTAFCGPLGTENRQQYSIIGSSVNLAARLMAATAPGQFYCDTQTRKLAADEFGFEEAGWTTPKGFREPVPIFEPGERTDRDDQRAMDVDLVGRQAELDLISGQIDAISAGGASRLLLIRAEPGFGKSALLQKARTLFDDRRMHVITGFTDAFETGTSYFAFRNIARRWCGVEAGDDAAQAIARLHEALRDAPDLPPLIPLLGPVLGLEFPETDLTLHLRGQPRSENTRRVLMHVAQRSFQRNPTALLIEDGHWMDGASWAFLEYLLENVESVLVLLSSRPLDGEAGKDARILQSDRAQVVDLRPISRADTEQMIRRQLGVSEVSAPTLDLVYDRAEGNPLFIREIVRNLLETGDARIRQSRVELLQRQTDAGPVPDTLDGVITSRIDRLEPDAQITIKAAAVLGRSFDAELLRAVHPLSVEPAFLAAQMDILEEHGFLRKEETGEDYVFHHALTRDAAYNLLSFAQREALHHKTALALETRHAGHADQVSARLGYHFRMAGIPDKAAPHLAAAGETAVESYASRDAIELLSTALQLDEAHRGADIGFDLSRARWRRLIGQAHYNQDNQSEAANWYRRAIDEAGVAPRYRLASIVPTLLRAIFNPASLDRPPSPKLSAGDRERITQGLASARELGAIYLWESALDKFALNAVNLVRMARVVGPTDESANAIATLAFMMSSAGLRGRSERVALQAVRMATDFGDNAQTIAVKVVAGMVLAQNGDPLRALPLFEDAKSAASELISGIWRHRCNYMLADALTWLGRYEQAQPIFLETARLSRSAEPHAVGQATAMAALNLLRMGRPEQAIRLLEGPDGVPSALEGGVPASAIMSLGVLAEARLASGRKDAALAAAEEAESHATEKDDGTGYYSGLFGYSSILSVRLQTGELGVAQNRRSGSAAHEDLKRVRKLAKVAPLGRATFSLWQGLMEAQRGRTGKARRRLEDAVKAATGAHQPFELGRGLVELARLHSGEERTRRLRQAVDVFQRHNMPLERARAQALLGS